MSHLVENKQSKLMCHHETLWGGFFQHDSTIYKLQRVFTHRESFSLFHRCTVRVFVTCRHQIISSLSVCTCAMWVVSQKKQNKKMSVSNLQQNHVLYVNYLMVTCLWITFFYCGVFIQHDLGLWIWICIVFLWNVTRITNQNLYLFWIRGLQLPQRFSVGTAGSCWVLLVDEQFSIFWNICSQTFLLLAQLYQFRGWSGGEDTTSGSSLPSAGKCWDVTQIVLSQEALGLSQRESQEKFKIHSRVWRC